MSAISLGQSLMGRKQSKIVFWYRDTISSMSYTLFTLQSILSIPNCGVSIVAANVFSFVSAISQHIVSHIVDLNNGQDMVSGSPVLANPQSSCSFSSGWW